MHKLNWLVKATLTNKESYHLMTLCLNSMPTHTQLSSRGTIHISLSQFKMPGLLLLPMSCRCNGSCHSRTPSKPHLHQRHCMSLWLYPHCPCMQGNALLSSFLEHGWCSACALYIIVYICNIQYRVYVCSSKCTNVEIIVYSFALWLCLACTICTLGMGVKQRNLGMHVSHIHSCWALLLLWLADSLWHIHNTYVKMLSSKSGPRKWQLGWPNFSSCIMLFRSCNQEHIWRGYNCESTCQAYLRSCCWTINSMAGHKKRKRLHMLWRYNIARIACPLPNHFAWSRCNTVSPIARGRPCWPRWMQWGQAVTR